MNVTAMKKCLSARSTIHKSIILAVGLGVFHSSLSAVDQPISIIYAEEEAPSILYLNSEPNSIFMHTIERPLPLCPDDEPVGEPDFFWDFGEELHAHPDSEGGLTVYSDQEGRYFINVYCGQTFQDANGNFYDTFTKPSNEDFE